MLYVLVDISETDIVFGIIGVFASPVDAIEFSGAPADTWHRINGEFHWDESGRFELVPFQVNEPRRWAAFERKHEIIQRHRASLEKWQAPAPDLSFDNVDGRIGFNAESMGAGACPACDGNGRRLRRWGTRLMRRTCEMCKGYG